MPNLKLTTKDIGKVLLVNIPPNKRSRYRWITRINENGRFIARAPKIGVRIRDLDLKRNSDYGPERVLPVSARKWSH